jgi:hypothetical protein
VLTCLRPVPKRKVDLKGGVWVKQNAGVRLHLQDFLKKLFLICRRNWHDLTGSAASRHSGLVGNKTSFCSFFYTVRVDCRALSCSVRRSWSLSRLSRNPYDALAVVIRCVAHEAPSGPSRCPTGITAGARARRKEQASLVGGGSSFSNVFLENTTRIAPLPILLSQWLARKGATN